MGQDIPGLSFDANTRRNKTQQPVMTRPTGGGTTTFLLPKTGLLSYIDLVIKGGVTGTLSAQNAYGFSSIVKRVRLTVNNGTDLLNFSGPGYHYLLRQMLGDYRDPVPMSNGRTAITATTYNVSMRLPVALNERDPLGLFLLQNEQTQVTLSIDWEADATVATGATVTGTATPVLVYFAVPANRKDYPPLGIVHSCIEEQVSIGATGDYTYNLPRQNIYLQMLFGYGCGASGADNWSGAQLRMQQNTYLQKETPDSMDVEFAGSHPAQRLAGTIPFDFLGTSGLGAFGKTRDAIDSSQLTDLAAVITATATGTLIALRRQLIITTPSAN